MAKLTVRKNARRPLSSKAKDSENRRQLESTAAAAQSRPRPKPRPTGKGAKLPQDSSRHSTVLSNTTNNDQEVRSIVAEALVSLSSTNAPPAPIDWHSRVMSDITPGVPSVTISDSDLEDSEDNGDEIDQLDSDSDNEEDISNGMS
jgi:hypothetical protein